jgi:hypothetical protein
VLDLWDAVLGRPRAADGGAQIQRHSQSALGSSWQFVYFCHLSSSSPVQSQLVPEVFWQTAL